MRFADGLYPFRAFQKIGGRMTYEGGGKDDPPPAPDYRGAAQQQGADSKELTTQQNYANRPNQQTPWGGTTWATQTAIDPSTGQPVTQWTQNLNLTPEAQAALDSQMAVQAGRSNIAQNILPRVGDEVSQAWDFSSFTPREGVNGVQLDTSAPNQLTQAGGNQYIADERRRIEDAAFERMQPEFDFRNESLRTRLANQGITEGSEAYKRAQKEEADLQARERWNAIEYGGNEQARMEAQQLAREGQAFGQDVSSQQTQNNALVAQLQAEIGAAGFTNNQRAQEIAEELQRRGMTVNEINALLTGAQVQMPQMPGFVTAQAPQATQFLSAAQLEGQHGLDVYNTQQMSKQGMMSGLFGLGGSAIQAWG